jgi:hypothetical protein
MIVAAGSAWCQASPQQSNHDNPQKKWQLKFSVGANFIPRQFDGFKFYLQRGISGNEAVRFGIGIRDYTQSTDRNDRIIISTEEFNRDIDRDIGMRMIALDLNYIAYISSQTDIRPYIGAGPFLDYTLNDHKQFDSGYGDSSLELSDIYKRRVLETGLSAIMGAEWRLSRLLVLQVEYSLRFYYERYRRDITHRNPFPSPEYNFESSDELDSYRVSAGYIRTGVSIMF